MDFEDLRIGYLSLYTGVVGDILDNMGYWNQIFPGEIQAIERGTKIFGEAFTVEGRLALDNSENDIPVRVEMLANIAENSIVVVAAQGTRVTGQWGEISALAARNNGCLGTVVDGGTRDVEQLLKHKLPVFARFCAPTESTGRWSVKRWNVPVRIDDVTVNPGDYILGDYDGVVAIPRNLAGEVLLQAQEKMIKEQDMREALSNGEKIKEVFLKFGHF